MYEATAAYVQASLASTSLVVGSMALLILGGIFTVAAVITLLKRNSINRP